MGGLCQSTSGQVTLELFWPDVAMETVSAAADRPTIETQKRLSISVLQNPDTRYFPRGISRSGANGRHQRIGPGWIELEL
jgi:hypothetical protein